MAVVVDVDVDVEVDVDVDVEVEVDVEVNVDVVVVVVVVVEKVFDDAVLDALEVLVAAGKSEAATEHCCTNVVVLYQTWKSHCK